MCDEANKQHVVAAYRQRVVNGDDAGVQSLHVLVDMNPLGFVSDLSMRGMGDNSIG
jgi:hypothetical protein